MGYRYQYRDRNILLHTTATRYLIPNPQIGWREEGREEQDIDIGIQQGQAQGGLGTLEIPVSKRWGWPSLRYFWCYIKHGRCEDIGIRQVSVSYPELGGGGCIPPTRYIHGYICRYVPHTSLPRYLHGHGNLIGYKQETLKLHGSLLC